ncbi:MAG TPA: hypothetical protein VK119_13165 [Bacillota bacterium]|nr:hypothetical protein [Bacillota bacterium]
MSLYFFARFSNRNFTTEDNNKNSQNISSLKLVSLLYWIQYHERMNRCDEKDDIQIHYTNLQELAWEASEVIDGVSDLANIMIPRLSYAETAKDEAVETMENVEINLDIFTSQGKNELVEEMLHHINMLMKNLRTQYGAARFRNLDT